MTTLLQSPNAANEDYRVKDLLDFDSYVDDLNITVESTARCSMIGIVGDYGVGKSVMLNTYREKYASTSDDTIWIQFDAWKYPDRSDLWEGFVLDFVYQYDPNRFEAIMKIIDGKDRDLVATVAKSATAWIPLAGKTLDQIISHFASTTPVKRVFEIQMLLEELIRNEKRRIHIVIEDADRSGATGIYLLETLNQFLKSLILDKEIKVFVPIARKSFDNPLQHDSYIKALDAIEFFQFTSRDMKKFVHEIFNSDFLKLPRYDHFTIEWTQRLLHNRKLTVREIKFIIRNSENRFRKLRQKGHDADGLIVYLLESGRYYKEVGKDESTAFESYQYSRSIPARSETALFLFALGHGLSISDMTDLLNPRAQASRLFKQDIVFEGDYERNINPATKSIHPVERNQQYHLPAFYIDD